MTNSVPVFPPLQALLACLAQLVQLASVLPLHTSA